MTTFLLLAAALAAIVLMVAIWPLLRLQGPVLDNSADKVNINIYRDQLRELEEDLSAGTIDQARHAEARTELETLLDAKVFIELWVKVRSGWADDEARVRSFGYE